VTLVDAIQRLLSFMAEQGLEPPSREIRIAEIVLHGTPNPYDSKGCLHIRRCDLRSVPDYETRFREMLETTLPWINVSCLGARTDFVLVAVEFSARYADRFNERIKGYVPLISFSSLSSETVSRTGWWDPYVVLDE
jgi:hypothetical protein